MSFCPRCGAAVGADWVFCGSCGHTLGRTAPRPDGEIATASTPWVMRHKVLSAAAAIFLLLVVIAVIASLTNNNIAGPPRPQRHAAPSDATAAPSPTPAPTEAPPVEVTPVPSRIEAISAIRLVDRLHVEPEHARAGYERDLFDVWIDADHDGCDTRREVLIDESLSPVTVGDRCSLSGGRWASAYDGVTTTDPSTFDVDHFVPLAEAWDSGAWSWSPSRRAMFGNDLGFGGSLMAVSRRSNTSKSDSDPTVWKPPLRSYWCSYAANWVAVKVRWQLTADVSEVASLRDMLGSCGTSAPPTVGPVATIAPAPRATNAPVATPASRSCHPSYPDFCIPPPPPDLDCDDVGRKRFTVRHDVPDPDPHRFDGNNDGVGCET